MTRPASFARPISMDNTASRIHQRTEWARTIARIAGQGTLSLFQSPELTVDLKEDRSPVTLADRRAESELRSAILNRFPEDSVLGEETGAVEGKTEFRWVLDPIDGTRSFIAGVPLFGTMVGIECQGRAVAGVIYFPALDELIYASSGNGCWSVRAADPPRTASVSKVSELSSARLVVTDTKSFRGRHAGPRLEALEDRASQVRTWGDCYGYYLVATGRADIMIDPILNEWDAVAAKPIIEEAGGVFCDWQGRYRTDSGDAVAANPQLMEQVLPILSG